MAYADQQMSGSRATAFVIVALIHVAVGYALVTGLAYEGARNVIKKLTTVDIKEPEKPKDTPPPPPPKQAAPPPIVAPPVKITIAVAPPIVQTVQTPPPAAPPPPAIILAPPAPPAPRFSPKSATPKGRPGDWATSNDYPSQALREEREGTTRFRVSVGADGRVTDCQVTGSSGSPDLDATACAKIKQRARFNPAMDGEGQPTTGTFASAVRWVIPKD
ncbi:MAG: TonB family protein [Novosphingobium sp.]